MVVLILAIPIFQSLSGWNAMPYKATLPGQLQHFLLGFLFADLFITHRFIFSIKNILWDILGVLGLVIMMRMWSDEWLKEIIFMVGLSLFFLSAFKGIIINYLLSNRWVIAIGGMCYTIYLIHLPLLELLTQWTANLSGFKSFGSYFLFQSIILLPMILTTSAVFYLLLEKPFMKPGWFTQMIRWIAYKMKYIHRMDFAKIKSVVFPLIIGISLASASNLYGQKIEEEASPVNKIVVIDFSNPDMIELMSLQEIISLAMVNSPLLKTQDVRIENFDNDLKLIRRKWTDYINVGANYLVGSSSYLDAIETVGILDYRVTNRDNSLANVAISARIPVGEIFTRKPKIAKVVNQRRIEELTKEVIVQQIRNAVMDHYSQLKASLELLRLKSHEVESLRLASVLAEEYLRNGELDLNAYTMTISRLARAKEEYLNHQTEANRANLKLQEIIGVSVITDSKQKSR
jgi:hypothetical protein